jgi:hypothetical protein
MLSALLLLATGAAVPQPPSVTLLAGTPEYRALKGPEQAFAGTLRRTPDGMGYVLETPDPFGPPRSRVDLYAPGKAHLLDARVGEFVRLTGKLDAGNPAKLYPARLERVGKGDRTGSDGVIARLPYALIGGVPVVARTVFTGAYLSGEQVAAVLRIDGPTRGETATRWLQARMQVPHIDWGKHSVVAVRAGLVAAPRKLVIARVQKEDRTLIVYWDWVMAAGTESGIQMAGEMALVPRHDGPIVFRRVGAATNRSDRR